MEINELNELKNNNRLVEVRTACILNRIYNYKNRNKFTNHMYILQCLTESIDEENRDRFLKLLEDSCQEKVLGASKKEIYAAMRVFSDDNSSLIAKRLGLSYSTMQRQYADLRCRDFINEKFIKELKEVSDEKTLEICRLINAFVDSLDYLTGDADYIHSDHNRSLEIEFWVLYDRLNHIFENPYYLERFMSKVCLLLEIDWGTISLLMKSIPNITRTSANQISGKQQFRQEVFNLFYLKVFKKYNIGQNIFGQKGSVFYTKGYDKSTKDITDNEWEFTMTYAATLDWSVLDKESVKKLINIFREFVDENL